MIIKRKYLTYGRLMKEERSKEAIYNAIRNSKMKLTEEEIESLLDGLYDIFVFNTDEGSCIPGDAYQAYCKAFEQLDKEFPYDNGLTYRNVSNVMPISNDKGDCVELIFYSGRWEEVPEIAQVVALRTDGSNVSTIDPWYYGQIGI